MAAVFISSQLRPRMKPRTWRGIHWLAYGCWPIALAHTFGLGTDAGEPWVIALGAACILAVGAALLWRVRATTRRAAELSLASVESPPVNRLLVTSSAPGARRGQ
jgi:DMSO/TMAO reductase YedYZ heme-binding membrane subunit